MSNESEQHNAEELSSEVKLIISLIAYAVFDCEKKPRSGSPLN